MRRVVNCEANIIIKNKTFNSLVAVFREDMSLEIFCKTDVGLVRSTNQDAFRYKKISDDCCWVVICDGMGGANGGNVASSVAVDVISGFFEDNIAEFNDEQIHLLISNALKEANKRIFERSKTDIQLSGMGTTAVVVVINNSVAHIAHVGDSRAYIFSSGDVKRLTLDHSFVQEMVNIGELTEEQARLHPNRNYITRVLGVDEHVKEDYTEIPFLKNEIILLCTDGLSNYYEADKLNNIINSCNCNELADKLIESANMQGGSDNITVAVICSDNDNYLNRSASNG